MEIDVLKFGGSSFADTADYLKVGAFLKARLEQGRRKLAVVVSGQSGTTGNLIRVGESLAKPMDGMTRDQLLSTAEVVSCAFMNLALNSLGVKSTFLCNGQIGIASDMGYTNALVEGVDPKPLLTCLSDHEVVIVAGGQAVNAAGRVTMLGRNSSDLTAIVVAKALGRREVEIFSDVPGIYTADPYVVARASLVDRVSYRTASLLSKHGAKVIHGRAVAFAREHGVAIKLSRLDPFLAGTTIDDGLDSLNDFIVTNDKWGLYEFANSGQRRLAALALLDRRCDHLQVDHEDKPCLLVERDSVPVDGCFEACGIAHTHHEHLAMLVHISHGAVTHRLLDRAQIGVAAPALHRQVCAEAEPGHFEKSRSANSGMLFRQAEAEAIPQYAALEGV